MDESERTLEDDGRFENRKKKNKEMVVDTLVGLRQKKEKRRNRVNDWGEFLGEEGGKRGVPRV